MAAFSSILEAGSSQEEKLRSLVEEIDTILAASSKLDLLKKKSFGLWLKR
jgi:hypothetical protein